MNGNTLALGLVGALTLVGAAQKRGSASRWDLFSPEDVHDQQSLSRRIRQLSDADKHALQADLNADRAAQADPNAARERVWHGAPHRNSCWPGKCAKNCVVAAIKQDGFRLTKGEYLQMQVFLIHYALGEYPLVAKILHADMPLTEIRLLT